MFHATIEAKYTCLSYMWEPPWLPIDQHTILINGNEMCIRQNLFDFLGTARASNHRPVYLRLWQELFDVLATAKTLPEIRPVYWIDALCINQQDGAERNHQVQQMGDIYSKADLVVSWLGKCSEDLAADIPEIYRNVMTRKYFSSDTNHSHRLVNKKKSEFLRLTSENPYWSRAWITQEMKLARRHTMVLGALLLNMAALTTMDREYLHYPTVTLKRFEPSDRIGRPQGPS